MTREEIIQSQRYLVCVAEKVTKKQLSEVVETHLTPPYFVSEWNSKRDPSDPLYINGQTNYLDWTQI